MKNAPLKILVSFHMPEALRDVLFGVAHYAREQRRSWQILSVNPGEFAANFEGHRADGAIVQVRPEEGALVKQLVRARTPVVNLLRDLTPQLPSVLSDNRAIGRAGANYLRSLGFKTMAFVSLDTIWSQQRQVGFTQALRETGLPAPITTESLGVKDFRFISNVRALKLLGKWARGLGPKVAVMTPSDFVARTFLDACAAEGIDVPKDLAVMGVDNFATLCDLWPVPLTSIAQDFPRMGFEAARLLGSRFTDWRAAVAPPVLIPPGPIQVRASTDVLAYEDPIVVETLRTIHESPEAGIAMSELLRRVPLSRRWLDQRFKQAVGHTPAEEIRRCRLRAAHDLLVETDLPVKLIARRCRFSFPENLIRSFKREYGVSPSSFRAKNRAVRA